MNARSPFTFPGLLCVCLGVVVLSTAQLQAQTLQRQIKPRTQDQAITLANPLDSGAMFRELSFGTNNGVGDLRTSSRYPLGPMLATTSQGKPGTHYLIKKSGNTVGKIHFSMTRQFGEFTAGAVGRRLTAVREQEKNNGTASHVWDDKWYLRTLPVSGDEYVLLFCHEWLSGRTEWAAIKNTPSKWLVLGSDGKIRTPGNGQNVKFGYKFTTANEVVDIDIHNPDNKNGYSANDILYGFGY